MNDFTIKCDFPEGSGRPVFPEKKPMTFAPPPETPTQKAPEGIRFDFNDGLRVRFPERGSYRCVFRDLETDCLLFSMDMNPGSGVSSVKKYFLRFRLEIFHSDDLAKPLFRHDLDLSGQEVLIQFPVGALGDTIAWFSYVERFQRKHRCRLFVSMEPRLAELFRDQYPEMTFLAKEDAARLKPYATYNLGLFFGGDTDHQPFDFRQVGLHRTAGHILGVEELSDVPPRVNLGRPRRIRDRYVCIASQASSQCKYWNNPSGWREVVAFLKGEGYRVLCIDQAPEYGTDYVWNHIPYGCEDFTGDKPLQERIDLLKDAEFFIGLSSGLTWLAWCSRVPVVMISGFTDPVNEFYTPYRVQNTTVCHGCWNDMRCEFNHFDFLWCPRKTEANGKFECTKAISSKMVIDRIRVLRKNLEKEMEGVRAGESVQK